LESGAIAVAFAVAELELRRMRTAGLIVAHTRGRFEAALSADFIEPLRHNHLSGRVVPSALFDGLEEVFVLLQGVTGALRKGHIAERHHRAGRHLIQRRIDPLSNDFVAHALINGRPLRSEQQFASGVFADELRKFLAVRRFARRAAILCGVRHDHGSRQMLIVVHFRHFAEDRVRTRRVSGVAEKRVSDPNERRAVFSEVTERAIAFIFDGFVLTAFAGDSVFEGSDDVNAGVIDIRVPAHVRIDHQIARCRGRELCGQTLRSGSGLGERVRQLHGLVQTYSIFCSDLLRLRGNLSAVAGHCPPTPDTVAAAGAGAAGDAAGGASGEQSETGAGLASGLGEKVVNSVHGKVRVPAHTIDAKDMTPIRLAPRAVPVGARYSVLEWDHPVA